MDSFLHPMLEGTFVLSGLQGLGKSTLAFTAEAGELTFVMDYDLKGRKMAKDYGIDQYHAPTFMAPDMDPSDYNADLIADWAIQTFKLIRPGTTTVVIDNATALELGLGRIVEKDPKKYGLNPKNVANGVYGGVNPGVSILWQNITSYLQSRGVRAIFMINHMTQPWANGAPVPNRFHIKGNKVFRQLSVGTFILTPGDASRGGKPPLPSALVIKEALALRGRDSVTGHPFTRRAIPMRFPIADWPDILGYFEKPADFANPLPGETWTKDELNSYGEFLSPEQLQWIKDSMKIGYSEEGSNKTTATKNPLVDKVKKAIMDHALLIGVMKSRQDKEGINKIASKVLPVIQGELDSLIDEKAADALVTRGKELVNDLKGSAEPAAA